MSLPAVQSLNAMKTGNPNPKSERSAQLEPGIARIGSEPGLPLDIGLRIYLGLRTSAFGFVT